VAVAALVAAVGGEAAVGRVLAGRGAELTAPNPAAGPGRTLLVDARDLPEARADRDWVQELPRSPFRGRPVGGPPSAPAIPGAWPVGGPEPAVPASLLMRLPSRLDGDGVTISTGSRQAPVTVTLYEDYRCRACGRFERAQGRMLAGLVADGTVRLRRVIGSSADLRRRGAGAHRAANAARAALEAGRFPLFNALLYEEQPYQRRHGFSVGRLLAIASRVPGLRGPDFDHAVRFQRYAPWVDASDKVWDRFGRRAGCAAPGLVVNGRPVDLSVRHDLAGDPRALRAFLLAARR
jgi:hypothetical protein